VIAGARRPGQRRRNPMPRSAPRRGRDWLSSAMVGAILSYNDPLKMRRAIQPEGPGRRAPATSDKAAFVRGQASAGCIEGPLDRRSRVPTRLDPPSSTENREEASLARAASAGLVQRMPRRRRLQYPGALYHVINRGNYRLPVFGSLRLDCSQIEGRKPQHPTLQRPTEPPTAPCTGLTP
jgi:hypothetical protein